MNKNSFGCYLFGSRANNSNLISSDVDLLLVCETKDFSDLELLIRIQVAQKFPEWKGLKLDVKHLPLGDVLPTHPVSILIAAEIKAKKSKPILGQDLIFQTIEISKELVLEAEISILRYWSKIFLNGTFDEAFLNIKSQRTLRSFYGCVLAFNTYKELVKDRNLMQVDPDQIKDKSFQMFRDFVQKKLNYSLVGLDAKQTQELISQTKIVFNFCCETWTEINRLNVRRIA